MADIYIVNVASSSVGWPTSFSRYYRTESEAVESFEECKARVGEDPTLIELIRLDGSTLKAVTITGWEGFVEDLEDYEEGAVDAT
jgi:hypothetical protein